MQIRIIEIAGSVCTLQIGDVFGEFIMCMNNVCVRHVNFQKKQYCRATIQHAMPKIVPVIITILVNKQYGIAIAE